MAESAFLKKVDDRNDVWLFIIALAVGFVGILGLKFSGAHQGWVTAFPSVILTAYFAYVWRTKRYQLRGDRAGDSVYYLGFLYTLLSLGISLFQFVFAGMGPREIVGNLGIALTTTILGLAGRVVLTQLREDPVEIEESARMALAEAAAQVRAELLQMVEDVNIFRRTTVQAIVEGSEEISRETNKALSENVTAFTSSARAVIDRIEEVFADFGDNAKRLNRASTKTVDALEKLIARVEAIEAPQTLISAKFDPLTDRIREVIQTFNARTEEQRHAVDRLRILVEETTAKAGTSLDGMAAVVETVAKAMESISSQTQSVTTNAEIVRSLSQALQATLDGATETQSKNSAKLAGAADAALQTLTSSVNRTLEELFESQRGTAEILAESLSRAMTSIESSIASLRDSAEQMREHSESKTTEALRTLTEQLDNIGEQARNAIQDQAMKLEAALGTGRASQLADEAWPHPATP